MLAGAIALRGAAAAAAVRQLPVAVTVAARRTFVSSAPVRGMEEFLPVEPKDPQQGQQPAGRAWSAAELRLKSFEDLHKLWFICLKERNMLLTDRMYWKQVGQAQSDPYRLMKVRQTMGAIKVVLGERARAQEALDKDNVRKAKVAELLASGVTAGGDVLRALAAERALKLAVARGETGHGPDGKSPHTMVTYKKFGHVFTVPSEKAPAKPTAAAKKRAANTARFWRGLAARRDELAAKQAKVGVEVPPLPSKQSAAAAAATSRQ